MNTQKNIRPLLIITVVCLLLVSCKKDVKEAAPVDISTTEVKKLEVSKSTTSDVQGLPSEEDIEKAKKADVKSTVEEPSKTAETHVFGNVDLPKITRKGSVSKMLTGDFTKTGTLSSLKGKKKIYAVGEVANLKGNVQVINGVSYVSTKVDGEMVIEETFNKDTALLVYAEVEQWRKIRVPVQVQSRGQFKIFILQQARAMGIDVKQPFPFMIEGNMRKLNFTIMNWNDLNPKDEPVRFFKSGYQAVMYNQDLEIVGFYSEPEKGNYLMNGQPYHAHFVTKNKEFAGHVDNIFLGQGMSLKLPLR